MGSQEYLGIAGMPEFITLSRALAFGGQSSAAVRENRIATVQALSGRVVGGWQEVGGRVIGWWVVGW